MMLVLAMFVVSVFCEVVAPWTLRRQVWTRTILASTATGLLLAISFGLYREAGLPLAVAVSLLSLYRIVNLLRIQKARMRPSYLRRVCLQTTAWLTGAQLLFWSMWALWYGWDGRDAAPGGLWIALGAAQLAVAGILYWTVRGHARRSQSPAAKPDGLADRELPTVTVAIAARNETESLLQCLESVLASSYPKLEVLVLDDCSQTRRTPDIIRSFAQAGVRFVPGAEPQANWLARNQAYDTLAQAASGEYIVFASTSLRMQPDTIRKMVGYVVTRKKTMLSILPNQTSLIGVPLIEPMRAAWELLPPRRWFGRPPVRNTCWLIKTAALKKAGGFKGVSRMVVPEAYFAKRFTEADGYSFLASGANYGVSSQKPAAEQLASALRVLYPGLHRRPEVVAATTALLLGCCVVPFAGVFAVFINASLAAYSATSLLTVLLLGLAYGQVLRLSYAVHPPSSHKSHGPHWSYNTALSLPVAVVAMLALEHTSLYKYEFGTVLWKDRNICVPVMRAIPQLPKI